MKKNKFIKKLIKNKKKVFVAVGVLVVILLSSLFLRGKEKKKIETTQVNKGIVKEELILSGEIKAVEHAELYFSTSGKVIWVGVSEGDEVYKGQALTKLDTTNLNADYQRALSDLRSAEVSVEKAHDDVKDHSSDETFSQKETRTAAEVAKDKAYEAVLKARENLNNATLISPFTGIITYIASPYVGNNILYNQKQVEVVNLDTIYFEVAADQSEVNDLKIGQDVEIILDSFLDETLKGVIDFINFTPKEDEVGTVYEVKVKFTNLDILKDRLRIGMTGDANFILLQKENVLYVPSRYVNSDSNGDFVYRGKRNNKVYVEVGVEGEERVEIVGVKEKSDQLKEGDTIYD